MTNIHRFLYEQGNLFLMFNRTILRYVPICNSLDGYLMAIVVCQRWNVRQSNPQAVVQKCTEIASFFDDCGHIYIKIKKKSLFVCKFVSQNM